jgi:hypothetical protein
MLSGMPTARAAAADASLPDARCRRSRTPSNGPTTWCKPRIVSPPRGSRRKVSSPDSVAVRIQFRHHGAQDRAGPGGNL